MLAMNVFQSVRPYFIGLGLYSPDGGPKRSVNIFSSIFLCLICLTVAFEVVFIIKIAKSFDEYALVCNGIQMLSIESFEFAIFIWKAKSFFKLMNKFEFIIQKSE